MPASITTVTPLPDDKALLGKLVLSSLLEKIAHTTTFEEKLTSS
jgi:hypothetical protein